MAPVLPPPRGWSRVMLRGVRRTSMTLYLVAWTSAYEPMGSWNITKPMHAQSPMAAAEKADPEPKSRVRVYPLQTDEWGNPEVYGFGSGKEEEEFVEIEVEE